MSVDCLAEMRLSLRLTTGQALDHQAASTSPRQSRAQPGPAAPGEQRRQGPATACVLHRHCGVFGDELFARRGRVSVGQRPNPSPATNRPLDGLRVGCSAGAMFGALIAVAHDAEAAVRIANTLWSAEVTRKRRWRAIPQLLWPRLGEANGGGVRLLSLATILFI